MAAKYVSQLYWAKYCVITIVFGMYIGLIGYRNISTTPATNLLHSQENRIFLADVAKKEALKTANK